jgi:hypothetical protein
MGPKEEERALRYNAQRMGETVEKPLNKKKADAAFARLKTKYPRVSYRTEEVALSKAVQGDFYPLYDVIDDFLEYHTNMDSTPGFPWCSLGADNALLLRDYRACIITTTASRIVLLATTPPEYIKSLTPLQKVAGGFMDPVRVMVKGEPHTVEKLKRAARIICCVSLVDSMVERFYSMKQNMKEIMNCMEIPSKPGCGVSEHNAEAMLGEVEGWYENRSVKRPVSTDCSGHDWTVTLDELMMDAQFRIEHRYRGVEGAELFDNIVYTRTLCAANTLFSLSDGTLIAQNTYGGLNSGSPNTSATTSRIRIYNAYRVGSLNATAMGDDCIEDPPSHMTDEDLVHAYLVECRKVIRSIDRSDLNAPTGPDGVTGTLLNFCSHEFFRRNGQADVRMMTWPKMLYKAISQVKDEDVKQLIADTLILYTRNVPEARDAFKQFCSATGWAKPRY